MVCLQWHGHGVVYNVLVCEALGACMDAHPYIGVLGYFIEGGGGVKIFAWRVVE